MPWGQVDLKSRDCAMNFDPIDADCSCETCRHQSRAALHTLLVQRESVGCNYLTIHNVHYVVAEWEGGACGREDVRVWVWVWVCVTTCVCASVRACMCVVVREYMCVSGICMHACVPVPVPVQMSLCMCMHGSACFYARVCVCACVHQYVCA